MKNMEISNAASVDALAPIEGIKELIFTVRGVHVLLDRDLARLYKVQTKVLNQAVKRNIQRFPERFMFQLTEVEMNELVTNCDRFLIVDNQLYMLGASVKDMGKGLCAIAPVGFSPEILLELLK